MEKRQEEFRRRFKTVFGEQYKKPITWHEGQQGNNKLPLPAYSNLRRKRKRVIRGNEDIEFGDLRTELNSYTVIVEYEDRVISVHNLVKYWPYICGELTVSPKGPILLCHFSDWYSYGSHRDLWQLIQGSIASDPRRLVNFWGRQFDHGGKLKSDRESAIRESAIKEATSWVLSHCTGQQSAN